MLFRHLLLLLPVLALSQTQTPPAAQTELDLKFAAAATDPALVVPLIVEVSALLPGVEGDAGQKLAERLEPFSKRAFFGPERLPGMEQLGLLLHTVAKGEFPSAIARQNHIGSGLLAYLNANYDERKLGAGSTLKVLDLAGDSLSVIIDKQRFRLACWHRIPSGAWALAMYVPIGIGAAETQTPSGTTKIVERARNCDWTDPVTHETFKAGDPRNVLGGYWMRLDEQGIGRTGIGLHGYTGSTPENWLGKCTSNGCVRLLQVDIDRVFELALDGTPVTIAP
jgi:hypothetical protein